MQRRRKPSRIGNDAMPEQLHQGGEGAENFATYSISASSYDDKNALKSESIMIFFNSYAHVHMHTLETMVFLCILFSNFIICSIF